MSDLLRPIIGIENRTAQEVFDIMCDRFRRFASHEPASRETQAGLCCTDGAQAGVVVKALEWSREAPYHVARAMGGHYSIERHDDDNGATYFWLTGTFSEVRGEYETIEIAKAAAETDYRARVLSCLETPPAQDTEPVALEQKKWREDGPVLRGVRLRFFRDLVPAERIKVYEVFGIERADLPDRLNHGIERHIFDQLFTTAPAAITDEMDAPLSDAIFHLIRDAYVRGYRWAQENPDSEDFLAKASYDYADKKTGTINLTAALGGQKDG
jgi:hypothetical protein